MQHVRSLVVAEELQYWHHAQTLKSHARAPRQFTRFLDEFFYYLTGLA